MNVVYIGRKPTMSYVTATDVAEITRRRFMKELDVGKITIGTEEIPQEEGETRNVSTIEITLKRE